MKKRAWLQFRTTRSCAGLAVLALCSVTAGATADVIKTDACGGPGGAMYHLVFNEGTQLSSIKVRAGKWINHLEFTYRRASGHSYSLNIGGVGGKSYAPFKVPSGAKLTEVNLRCGVYVDSIQFRFSDGSTSPKYGGGGGQPMTIRFPPNSTFRGIHGGGGTPSSSIGYVDRIGFFYSERAADIAAKPAPTPVAFQAR